MVSCARATRHTGLIERLHCGRCSSTRARLRPIGLPSEVRGTSKLGRSIYKAVLLRFGITQVGG